VPPLSELANSYGKIEALLRDRQWNEAVELLNRRGQFRDAPKHLEPLIHEAYEHFCRAKAWKEFQRIRPEKSELHDRKLVNAWNESLFAGYGPAEKQRDRVGKARRRVRALDRLHLLVQKSPNATSLEEERTIVSAAGRLPGGYTFGLQARVERARRSVDAVRWLEQSIEEDADDVAIATMWKKVVEAEAKHLVPREHYKRIELAVRRASRLLALRRLSAEMPADRRDQVLLEVWDDTLMADCPEAERWREMHRQAVERAAELKKVEDAVTRRADRELVELFDGELLSGYPVPPGWQAVVDNARQRVTIVDTLEKALAGDDRRAFVEAFDARLISQFQDRLERYQATILQWTKSEVLAADVMGLSLAVGRASLAEVDSQTGAYRVRWTWPPPRFTDECLLAVVREKPGACDTAEDHELLHQETIDRTTWETGGGSRTLEADASWEGCYAVAWAVVDLGSRRFHSEPLVLGEFVDVSSRQDAGRKGWRLFGGARQNGTSKAEEEQPIAETESEEEV
jgi:hypothetical protein